jgi:hypothetical protein
MGNDKSWEFFARLIHGTYLSASALSALPQRAKLGAKG